MCGANRLPGEHETTLAIFSKHVHVECDCFSWYGNSIYHLGLEGNFCPWIFAGATGGVGVGVAGAVVVEVVVATKEWALRQGATPMRRRALQRERAGRGGMQLPWRAQEEVASRRKWWPRAGREEKEEACVLWPRGGGRKSCVLPPPPSKGLDRHRPSSPSLY
jgi:hypothetical protein